MDALTEEQIEELRRDLFALRAELSRDVESSADGVRPVDLDEPIGRLSRMDAMQQQAMAQATRQAAVLRLRLVDTALRRMTNDEFGLCMECEEDVGYARLKARPEALLCVACQEQRESS
jgi:DnaK suppressor protein